MNRRHGSQHFSSFPAPTAHTLLLHAHGAHTYRQTRIHITWKRIKHKREGTVIWWPFSGVRLWSFVRDEAHPCITNPRKDRWCTRHSASLTATPPPLLVSHRAKWHTLMPALASFTASSAVNRHDGQAIPISECAREGSWDWEALGRSIPQIQKVRHTDIEVTLVLTPDRATDWISEIK